MAAYLVSQGHQVHVITGYPYYPQWKVHEGYNNKGFSSETINGVSVTRCPLYVPAHPSGFKRILQDFSFFFSSWFAITSLIIRQKNFDVVFSVAPSFMNGLTGLWYKLFFPSTKLVYHLQDLQIDAAMDLGIIKNKFLLSILYNAEKFIFRRVDLVSTITEGMRKKILSKNVVIKSTIVFPNWTNICTNTNDKQNNAVLVNFGIPTDKRIIFYSGAIGEKQGLEMIFDVAEISNRLLPDAIFLISGDGPYTVQLKKHAASRALPNLMFIPLQEKDVYIQLIHLSSINLVLQKRAASDLVMPSKLATILGAGGVAVVSAERGTSLEALIAEHGFAAAVEPENARDLFEKIQFLTSSADASALIVQKASTYAEQNLSKEQVIGRFISELSL